MPLNKTITRSDGVVMTYWRETELAIQSVNGVPTKLWSKLQGYLDKPAYQAGKTPVEDRSFTMNLPSTYLTDTTTTLVLAMRDYIKTTEEFTGATNAT